MKLVQKAYIVFHKDDILSLRFTWTHYEYTRVKPHEGASVAKKQALDCFDCLYVDLRARRAKSNDLYQYGERQLTRESISREEKLIDWQISMQRLIEENPNSKVHIYSDQWGAYWRPNSCGYTYEKKEAGIYDIKEAWDCVSHCGLEKKISFEIIK